MPEHYDDIRSMIKSKKSCRYAGSPTKEHERFTRLIKYGLSDFPDTEETRRSWISSLDRLDPDMVTGFIRWLNNYGGSEVGGPIASLSDLYDIDSSAVPNLMMDLEMYLNENDQGAQPQMEPGLPPEDQTEDDAEILETNQRPKGIKEVNYGKAPDIDLESEKLKEDEAAIAAENEGKGEKSEEKGEKSEKKDEKSDKKDEKTESSTKSVKKSDAEELQDDEPAPEMEDSDDSDGDIEYSDLAGILVDIEDSLGKEVADEILDILMEHLDDDEFDAVMEAKEDAEGDPGVSESESFEEEEPETVSEEDNEPEEGYVSIRECINLRKSGKKNASYLMEMTAFRKANQSGQPLPGPTPDPTSENGTNTNTSDPSQMRQQYQQARQQNAQARHGTQAHSASPQEQVRQNLEEAMNQPDPFKPAWEGRQQNNSQKTPGPEEGRMTDEQRAEAKRRYREQRAREREEELKTKMAERGKQEYQERNAPADPNAASRTAATQAKRQAKKKKNAKGEAQQPVKEDAQQPAQSDAQQPVQSDAQQPVQEDKNAASRTAAAQNNREQAKKEKAARDAKKQEILQGQSDAYNAQYGANAQAANRQAPAGAGAGGSGGNYYSMFGSRLNGQPGLLSRLAQWIRNYRLNRMKIKQAGQQATAGAAPAPTPAPAPAPQQNPAA